MEEITRGADMDSDYADAMAARWKRQSQDWQALEFRTMISEAEALIARVAPYFNGTEQEKAYASRATENAKWEINYASAKIAEIYAA